MSMPPGRVLVVDDEDHVASMLKEAVRYFGYAVELALSGEEALQAFPVFQPDVVLLDFTLPGMSGAMTLESLHALDPQVPVIMLTGNTDVEVARRLLDQGAFDYIAKPFQLERLRHVLEAAMASRG
jgi:DNA-binding response OmpR family regulator